VGGGYIQLNADGLAAGSGMWEMAPDQLERYRAAVDDDRSGTALERVVNDTRDKELEVMSHGELKTAPRGYPKDHPRIELLRYKGIVTWRSWTPAAWLGTKRSKDRIVEFLHLSEPLNDWLTKHVGPSTLPSSR
jgi:uncharacterized protein (DUF2461 family)